MRVLLLKYILFAPEVMVKNDLLLQVIRHLVSNLVGLINALRDRLVPRLKLVECSYLSLQVFI